jgi:hypothetical protein
MYVIEKLKLLSLFPYKMKNVQGPGGKVCDFSTNFESQQISQQLDLGSSRSNLNYFCVWWFRLIFVASPSKINQSGI